MELKDEDIKKALECCLEPRHDCSDCLLEKEVYCTSLLHKSILDFINRQQAEIERLKYLLEREEKATESFSKQCYKDGIKEFAERLKENQRTFIGDEYAYEFIPSIEIDVLLAEKAGEQDEKENICI